MEERYTFLTADIEEIKSLPSAHYVAVDVSHEYAIKMEKLLKAGQDPNHRVAHVLFMEIKK